MGRAPKKNYRLDVLEALLDGALSKYGIANRTGIPYPTVLRIVKELEGQGYIRRLPGTTARGAHRYEITVHGIMELCLERRIDARKERMWILSRSRLAPIITPKVIERSFDVDKGGYLIRLISVIDTHFAPRTVSPRDRLLSVEQSMIEVYESVVLRSFPMWRDELTSDVLERLSEEEKDKIIEAIYDDISKFLAMYIQYFYRIIPLSELAAKIRPKEGKKIEKMLKEFLKIPVSRIGQLAERKEMPSEIVKRLQDFLRR